MFVLLSKINHMCQVQGYDEEAYMYMYTHTHTHTLYMYDVYTCMQI